MTATDFSNILRNCDEETYSVIVNLWTENRWYQNPRAFVHERVAIQQYADAQYRLASEYADKVNEYSEEIQKLREENDSFRARFIDLENKNEELENKNEDLCQEIVGYQIENDTRKTINESGELEAQAHKMEADTLRYYNENLEKELTDLKSTSSYWGGCEYNTTPREVSVNSGENVRNWDNIPSPKPTKCTGSSYIEKPTCVFNPSVTRHNVSKENTFTDSDDESTWPSVTTGNDTDTTYTDMPGLEPTPDSDSELTGWTIPENTNDKNKKRVRFSPPPVSIPTGAKTLDELSLESHRLHTLSGWDFKN